MQDNMLVSSILLVDLSLSAAQILPRAFSAGRILLRLIINTDASKNVHPQTCLFHLKMVFSAYSQDPSET
jgi:hypothetical protein